MRTQFLVSILAAAMAVNAQTQPAPVVADSPAGAQYIATLPKIGKWEVEGVVSASSAPDGKGTKFDVAIAGLPAEGGPFMYHLHEKPVPADGNCTGAGAHIDPYKRGEVPICDASKPETCQTGDLSGKFGNATARDLAASYIDPFTSTDPANPSFFGNLSVVVHLSNKTRISCANFSLVALGAGISSSAPVSLPSTGYAMPTGTGTGGHNATLSISATATSTGSGGSGSATGSPIAPTAAPPQSTSGAQKLTSRVGVVVGAVLAMML